MGPQNGFEGPGWNQWFFFFPFFSPQILWRNENGNHPQEDLTKFGNITRYESQNFKISFYKLLLVAIHQLETYSTSLVFFFLFFFFEESSQPWLFFFSEECFWYTSKSVYSCQNKKNPTPPSPTLLPQEK